MFDWGLTILHQVGLVTEATPLKPTFNPEQPALRNSAYLAPCA